MQAPGYVARRSQTKKKRKREEKEGRKEGGAGNFDFQLASRFLSKNKPRW
jgi:hypothetical protein